ncbi:uracil phosphoribosyltransferase [Crassisporium funariophilum]|nr:uracil phosphoribosyltransferase [Crassisporium funariophilum]
MSSIDPSDSPMSDFTTTTTSTNMSSEIWKANASTPCQPEIPANEASIKPIVIGVYGISGCGKSTLLGQLKDKLGTFKYQFCEGAEVITSILQGPDGLESFRNFSPERKTQIREMAIRKIARDAADNKKIAIVTGHFMFWSDKGDDGDVVWTQGDLETYTNIVYLDLPQKTLASRRERDIGKIREHISEEDLSTWKCFERDQLRRRCYEAGILFTAFKYPEVESVARLVDDWVNVTEDLNVSRALAHLDNLLEKTHRDTSLRTVLVMDGDKTLTNEDTGKLFWKIALSRRQIYLNPDPLKAIFGGKGGYSFNAFRQAALLYGEVSEFDDLCLVVAKLVTVHPEFIKFVEYVAQDAGSRVKVLVVTCGLAGLWETILHDGYGLEHIEVIGAGRHPDTFVVTPSVKSALVSRLQSRYGARVWAFGDSSLDLPMLARADEAIVVVGAEESRSRSMESALMKAIDHEGLRARQVLLGETTQPRLDTSRLPVIQLQDQDFLYSITRGATHSLPDNVVHLTDTPAAQVLMTSTRDASISGPELRRAHEKIGWFLATQCITKVIGLENREIAHVQGYTVTGHSLRNESRTIIIALMRGGEPMAFGVNEAFPQASFVHARHAADLRAEHLLGQRTVVLVDSVVNSGKSVVEFVQHIRRLQAELQIVVVAGVVQEQALLRGELYEQLSREGGRLRIVALRLSRNKFTGKGGTDTGNRLFNTAWLDGSRCD